nr:retrotransposon Gag domain, retroviral aspartyl protease [Tanacetum cinerariifolium]
MVQTKNSENNNPPDPIAIQLAAIAVKLEAIKMMKEDIATLKEGSRSRLSKNFKGKFLDASRIVLEANDEVEEPLTTDLTGLKTDWVETTEISLHAIQKKPHPTTMKVHDGKRYKLEGIVTGPQKSFSFQHLAVEPEVIPCIRAPLQPNLVITHRRVYEAGQPVLELLIAWCNRDVEEATWETYDLVAEQFPKFRLEDKAFYQEGSNDKNPFKYASIFTKGLPSALFEDFCFSLSVRLPSAQTARAY